ncbi:MAG: HD domain-containing protein, partial [bacterium]
LKLHKDKNGNPYYRLVLADKTGEIKANIWGDKMPDCETRDLKRGDIVSVDAVVDSYNEKTQLNILSLKKVKSGDYDLSDLLQVSRFDIDELWERLELQISKIKDDDYKALIKNIFKDDKTKKAYRSITAGIGVHHDFVGGLLEHVVEMIDIAKSMKKWYPEANFDLVVTGILLHDIGKTEEIISIGTTFDKTERGRLVGHIVLGTELILRNLPKDFPEQKKTMIQHIILSHHGELQFGAVVVPMTMEAQIVSMVDRASSHVRIFQEVLGRHASDSSFTDYSKYANASLFVSSTEMLDKIKQQLSLKDFEDEDYLTDEQKKLL